MRQTSGTVFTAFSTLIGNPSRRNTMNECPAPIACAFRCASAIRSSSLPAQRTRQGPDASQKANPNCRPGTEPTSTSYRSSTVLMKCECPRMKFRSSGFSIRTVLMSTRGLPD
jgi:hypothetical protein